MLEDSRFKNWLAVESKDTANCKHCQKTYKKGNTGVSYVISHGQGKIHKCRDSTASSYSTLTFKPKTAVSSLSNSKIFVSAKNCRHKLKII